MALRHSGNQTTYIRALLAFREYQLNGNVYHLAFSGRGGVVQRAKRIASRTNPTLGAAEKTILLVAVFAFFTFSILFAHTGGRQTGGRQSGGRQSGGRHAQAEPQKGNATQAVRSGKKKISVSSPKNQADAQPNNIQNQSINPENTGNKQAAGNPAQNTKHRNLTWADTLQPLQKPLAPLYQPIAPVYADSSARARLAPVEWQPYQQKYKAQPLQSYQHEYQPNPIRIKRQAINEKIMDAIEQQGIAISRNEIDFRITNQELILNGIRQPEAVHKNVLKAVLTSPDDVIDFTYGSHK
jgi:hypothetical protein